MALKGDCNVGGGVKEGEKISGLNCDGQNFECAWFKFLSSLFFVIMESFECVCGCVEFEL